MCGEKKRRTKRQIEKTFSALCQQRNFCPQMWLEEARKLNSPMQYFSY